MTEINSKTPMEKLTEGGTIYEAGNAREFKTGDWRSVRPVSYTHLPSPRDPKTSRIPSCG